MDEELLGVAMVEVAADMEAYDRAMAEVPRGAKRAAEQAEAALTAGYKKAWQRVKHVLGGEDAKKTGQNAADKLVEGLRQELNENLAYIKRDFHRGILDETQMNRAGREARRQFNRGLLQGFDRMEASGQLTGDMRVSMLRQLDDIGMQSGKKFGDSVNKGARPGMRDFTAAFKAIFAIELVRVILDFAGIMTRALRQAAQAFIGLVEQGSKVDRLTMSFTALVTQLGMIPDDVLGGLRRATRGAVPDIELMQRAITALQAQLPITSTELERMAYLSRRLAEAQGRDAVEGFNRFVSGIAKGEQNLLEEIGILTRAEDAFRKYRQETGKSADTLSGTAKIQVYFNAVMEEAERKVEQLGDESQNAGVTFAFLRTTMSNVLDETGRLVANSPTLSRLLGDIASDTDAAADKVDYLAANIAAFVETVLQLGERLSDSWLAKAFGWEVRTGAKLLGLGDIGGMFGENLAGIQGRQAEERRMSELRAENDINALLARQTELREDILDQTNRLKNATSEQAGAMVSGIMKAGEELAVVERRINQLRNPPTPPTPPVTPMSEADLNRIENARRALQDQIEEFDMRAKYFQTQQRPEGVEASINRIVQIDRELFQLEKQITEARNRVPPGIERVTAALREQRAELQGTLDAALDKFNNFPQIEARIARIAPAVRRIAGPMVDMGETFVSITAATDGITRALKESAEAAEELSRAQLSGDAARITRARKEQEQVERRLAAATARAMAVYEQGLAGGQIDQRELNKLIAEMVELLKEAGIEAADISAPDSTDWGKIARDVEGLARGVLSVADAMGVLDEDTQAALESVVEIASGVARLVASGGTDIGAWFQTAGGLIKGGMALFGGDPEAARRNRDAMNDLTRAIRDLEEAVLNDMSTREIEASQAAVGQAAGILGADRDAFSSRGFVRRRALAELSRDIGLVESTKDKAGAIEALRQWAAELDEQYGTNLAEFIENSDTRGLLDALRTLGIQLGEEVGELGTFGNDVAGIMERVNWEFQILGRTDVSAKLRDLVAALQAAGHSAGEFQDELNALAGIDLSTAEGRAERDRIVGEMVARMLEGGADFGNLSPEELRAIVEEFANAEPGEGTAGTTGGYEVTRGITEITANRLLGTMSTSNFWLETIAGYTGEMARGMLGAGFVPPVIQAPTPEQLAAGPGIQVNVGGIAVAVEIQVVESIVATDEFGAAGERAGEAFTDRFAETVDRELGARLVDYNRAYGQ